MNNFKKSAGNNTNYWTLPYSISLIALLIFTNFLDSFNQDEHLNQQGIQRYKLNANKYD